MMNFNENKYNNNICKNEHFVQRASESTRRETLWGQKGEHIQIMELNGITADAAHIFDPNARLRDALGIQISNCIQSFKIARYNIRKGAKTTPVLELYKKSVNGY